MKRAFTLAILGCLLLIGGWATPTPHRIQLANGLQLIVERIPDAPLTAVEVWIRAGVADETPQTSGVAHLLEHLIFKGSADLPPGALDEVFEQAGGVLDASTERDWTRYRASVLPDQWQKPLQTLLRCLLYPALPEAELEKERRIILKDEYALHSTDPIRPARYALFAQAFKQHPYGLPLLGDPETLARISREPVRQFHQQHYRPDRMIVVVVGAVDAGMVKKTVEEALVAPHSHQAGAEGSARVSVAARKGVEGQGNLTVLRSDRCLTIGVPTPPASDIEGWLCAEILRIALGEPYQGLLYEGESLPFGRLQSEYLPRLQGSVIAFYLLPPVEPMDDWQTVARQRFERALRKIADGDARAALEQARAIALVRHESAIRNQLERARWYGLGAALQIPLSPEEYAARLNDVSVEKVEAFVRALVGETPTLQGVATSMRTPTLRPRNALRQRLSNGLRVIAVSAPESQSVIIQVAVGHHRSDFSAVAGELTARMLFGETQNETERTLAARIARSGGSLRVAWTPAGALITAYARPDSVINVLSLLKEALFRAEFTESALQRAVRQAMYDRLYQEGAQGWRLGARLLGCYAEEETLQRVPLDAIRAYYQAHYRPGNLVMVIAGSLRSERSIEFVQQLFGGEWAFPRAPQSQHAEGAYLLRLGRLTDPRGNSYLGYGWVSPVRNPEEYHILQGLQLLLMEGKRARLFLETRERSGVGYALQSERAMVKSGVLGIGWIQTGNLPLPESVVQHVLEQPIQPKEWQRAQNLLRGEWERLRMNLNAFTEALGWAELSGIGYEAVWNTPTVSDYEQAETMRMRLVSALLSHVHRD
ncbi:MAG: insulinase family protein [Fimbriimonadales bacterium]|nr:insulinase family protein [Fimbriimonadales bacterium]